MAGGFLCIFIMRGDTSLSYVMRIAVFSRLIRQALNNLICDKFYIFDNSY